MTPGDKQQQQPEQETKVSGEAVSSEEVQQLQPAAAGNDGGEAVGCGGESPGLSGRSDDENVGLLERTLRGLTARAVLGVPGMASQRPCAVLARELLEQEESVDAAVEKCSDLGGRRWSDATARFVFGFVPFVGGMGVQLEEMWLQIRCVAIIAALYGHDVEAEDVQQKIILCLMDGAATQVADGSAKLQMERVALQQVLRKLVLSMSGASSLEGLFNGVTGSLRGAWSGGRPPPALLERCKTHFKPRSALRQPSTSTLWIGVMAASLLLCKLVTPVTKLIELPTKIVKPREQLDAKPWLGPLITIVAALIVVAIVALAIKLVVSRSRRTLSTVPLVAFLGLAGLQAVLAMNMSEDFLNVILHRTSAVRVLYHFHRGAYGAIGLVNHAREIRTGTIPTEWKQAKTGLQVSLLYWPWHALSIGMPIPTYMIVVDIIALVCQNVLMDTLKRFEVLTALITRIFGTSQLMVAIENLLLHAGSVVANPQKVLTYLDDITPTKNECCFVVTLRDIAVFIGVAHAPIQMLLTSKMLNDGQKGMMVLTELSAIGMALSIRMQFVRDEIQEELEGRCRLFTIIPADAHGKDKMKRAIDWVAKFEQTVTPIRNVTSSISKATTDSLSHIRQSVSSVAQSVASTETVAGVYNTLGSLQSSVSQRALAAEKARMEAIMQEALKNEDKGDDFDMVDEATDRPASGTVGWSSFASAMTRVTGGRVEDDAEHDDDWGENSTDGSACTPRDLAVHPISEPDPHDDQRSQAPDGDGNLSAVVESQADFEVEIEVSEDSSSDGNNEIQWSFQLDCTRQSVLQASSASLGVDIGFEVLYRGQSVSHSEVESSGKQSSPGKPNMSRMIPYKRHALSATPSVGSLPAIFPGTYILRWDNSYSWTTAKRIKYCVWVGPKPLSPGVETEAKSEAESNTSPSELGGQAFSVTQSPAPLEQAQQSGSSTHSDKDQIHVVDEDPSTPEARRDSADEDDADKRKVPQGEIKSDCYREDKVTATTGSLASPAAWLSGLVPGGSNDMTTAVANAATWARQRDIEAQKAEMRRKIEEALAAEAVKDEEAAAELAARRQREMEALGVTSDADDVASRILRRRAAASRARATGSMPKHPPQDTSVVQSSALRSTAFVLPVATADDQEGASSLAPVSAAPGLSPTSPERNLKITFAATKPEPPAEPEDAPPELVRQQPQPEPQLHPAPQGNLPSAEDDFGDAPDIDDDAFDVIDEARLSPAMSFVETPSTTSVEALSKTSDGTSGQRNVMQSSSSRARVATSCTNARFGMDSEMIRRSKLTRKFTQLRDNISNGGSALSDGIENGSAQIEQQPRLRPKPELSSLDIETHDDSAPASFTNATCHDDGTGTDSGNVTPKRGKSPRSVGDSPLAAKMRLLAAEIAAEVEAGAETEAEPKLEMSQEGHGVALQQGQTDRELQAGVTQLQEKEEERPGTRKSAPEELEFNTATAATGEKPETEPPSDGTGSSSPPGATSWLRNWMPGGSNDVTSVVVSAATWAQQRDIDAQKAEMERKIEMALVAEEKEKERMAAEESARQAQELAALGVSDSADTEADDFATRILKKRAAARAQKALVATRK